MGIPLVNNGPSQLAKYIGLMKAAEITLFGKEINSFEAIEYGLASEATPDGTGRQILRSLNTNILILFLQINIFAIDSFGKCNYSSHFFIFPSAICTTVRL